MNLGDVDPGPVIGGFLGAIFLGGAYLAIGLFLSSITENQIVAFILGVVACFALFIIGETLVLITAPQSLAPLLPEPRARRALREHRAGGDRHPGRDLLPERDRCSSSS